VGSSVFGFAGGFVFQHWGWDALVWSVAGLFALGLLIALFTLPAKPRASA
jgi:predicted MFS family arabinose efflux permease